MSEAFSDDSFIDFECPYCGVVNSFPSAAIHTVQECASCMDSVIVPEAGATKGNKIPLPIRTERLVIRRFHHEDARKLLKLVTEDEESVLPVTEMNVEEFIEQHRATRISKAESGIYLVIEVAESQELAGYAVISYREREHDNATFDFRISPARRRQGLGFQVMQALIDFAFNGMCARRIMVFCPSLNSSARRTVEKAGLRQEGEGIKSFFDGKDWVNMSWYALLAEERQGQ